MLGPIGWALLAGAAIYSIIQANKKTKQTAMEEATKDTRIGSKIDVTNNQLQNVNRNLIALKTTMETYILPESSYFSEKRNLEDEFAISSKRGS